MDRRRRSQGTTAALAVALLLTLAACAPGPNAVADTAALTANQAGFWPGLWHGIILPVTFVVSLFTDSVSVYEVHNTGNWYDVGYVLGISLVFGGPFGARRARG